MAQFPSTEFQTRHAASQKPSLIPPSNAILTFMSIFQKSEKVVVHKHTPLAGAVLRSDYSAIRELAAAGADLNGFDDHRMTPLLWAIMRGDIDAVRLLLESGADPNVRPNPSDSPLWSAEDDFGLHEIAALLKSYGATK